MKRALCRVLLACACAALAGCANVGYYVRSMQGQLEIFRRERPISELVAAPETPPALRDRLETALSIREYASAALALPNNESYRRYADLQRPFVAYNVFATPEFSLTPVEWCFPFAGCVKYRGYFSREEAERYAADMARQGYDVFVGGVPAYSTLGWFADPVLNTFVGYPRPELARLIFHELAHQLLYVRDDSVFNESFAVTVEQEGVKRWLERHGTEQDRQVYARVQERRREFMDLVQKHRRELEVVYASDLPVEEKRARKQAVYADLDVAYEALRRTWGVIGTADRWLGQRPNNSLMASVSIYTQLVPSFEALLRQDGGDLPAFYADVRKLSQLPAPERSARLAALKVRAAAATP